MIVVEKPFYFTICWFCESGLIYLQEEVTTDFEGVACVVCRNCNHSNEVPDEQRDN